jgi:AraC-like DNA-binding protein
MAQRAKISRSCFGASRWELASRPLPEPLRPFVRELMGYSESTAGLVSQRQLPGPMVVAIVEFGPPIRMSDPVLRDARFAGGFVAGVSDFVTVTEHDGYQSGIQIDLTPVGARALFGVPMDELAGTTVALPDLLPRGERHLAERLEALRDWDARFDAIEQLLAGLLERMTERGATVGWACARLQATAGGIDMRALARELGYSEKHVVRLFRDQVGMAPKQFARLIRFDRLVQRLRRGCDAPWSALAAELGYYDQAHLVRDVRQFAGVTPTEARASLQSLFPAAR